MASLGPQADSLNEKSNAFLQRQRITNLKRQLYNERSSLSREAKKNEEVIIVEGYMDVISIYSSGIKNVKFLNFIAKKRIF